MASLHPDLRRFLEAKVIEARDVAETAARSALVQLAVPNTEPFTNMSIPQRELRRSLRAKARQLGDRRRWLGAGGRLCLADAAADLPLR